MSHTTIAAATATASDTPAVSQAVPSACLAMRRATKATRGSRSRPACGNTNVPAAPVVDAVVSNPSARKYAYWIADGAGGGSTVTTLEDV